MSKYKWGGLGLGVHANMDSLVSDKTHVFFMQPSF